MSSKVMTSSLWCFVKKQQNICALKGRQVLKEVDLLARWGGCVAADRERTPAVSQALLQLRVLQVRAFCSASPAKCECVGVWRGERVLEQDSVPHFLKKGLIILIIHFHFCLLEFLDPSVKGSAAPHLRFEFMHDGPISQGLPGPFPTHDGPRRVALEPQNSSQHMSGHASRSAPSNKQPAFQPNPHDAASGHGSLAGPQCQNEWRRPKQASCFLALGWLSVQLGTTAWSCHRWPFSPKESPTPTGGPTSIIERLSLLKTTESSSTCLREKYVFSYGFGTGFSGFCTGKLRVRNYGVLEIRVFSNGNTGFPNGNTGFPAGSTGLSNGNTGFPARKRFPTGNAGLLAKSHQVLCCLAPTSSQIFRRLGAASNLVWEERTKLGGNC